MASHRILPGFRLSLSLAISYLCLLVVIPLAALIAKASSLTFEQFLAAAWTPRAQAAYFVTFSTSAIAAVTDTILGLLLAWVLVRYEFPFKRLFDSLVDLPFALPTAVAGLVYSSLYVPKGWIGQFLVPMGIELAYSTSAIVLVLTFIGLPFVVRTVQPVLESMDADIEEAAACLGATRWQTFTRVILPALYPALTTGFALTFARAIGEYGSVVFVSSNTPLKTEIAPVLIVQKLDEFKWAEATAVAVVLLIASFIMLIIINALERRTSAANSSAN
ncbi:MULTISPECIES: sulfate ABC transporter permease subunit CysT [unclassified Schlesneria]|uniref:sulfate ABC transporter permease subunit CysT n=1 Tax=Schlesneria TaxID=656899 RepID=UPI002EF45D52